MKEVPYKVAIPTIGLEEGIVTFIILVAIVIVFLEA